MVSHGKQVGMFCTNPVYESAANSGIMWQRSAVSEVAADWQELPAPQCILGPSITLSAATLCSMQT